VLFEVDDPSPEFWPRLLVAFQPQNFVEFDFLHDFAPKWKAGASRPSVSHCGYIVA